MPVICIGNIMREQPDAVLKRLGQAVLRITGSRRRSSPTPRCALASLARRLPHATSSWLMRSAPASMLSWPATGDIKVALRTASTPIGPNDTAIARHAIAVGAILVTNNTREFERAPGLNLEDWAK